MRLDLIHSHRKHADSRDRRILVPHRMEADRPLESRQGGLSSAHSSVLGHPAVDASEHIVAVCS